MFYTGGPAQVSSEGLLACACGDEVKVTACSRTLFFAPSAEGAFCKHPKLLPHLLIAHCTTYVYLLAVGSVNLALPCYWHLTLQQTSLGEISVLVYQASALTIRHTHKLSFRAAVLDWLTSTSAQTLRHTRKLSSQAAVPAIADLHTCKRVGGGGGQRPSAGHAARRQRARYRAGVVAVRPPRVQCLAQPAAARLGRRAAGGRRPPRRRGRGGCRP